ncbi:hypothetical protein TNCT_306881 [Trichonephila clavata]|uniref:VWFC domain-containing protein n=1 Tax=Trichonephila clavata TaxID=2740835 RepID=A0A8X6GLL9_TRICU|nr:hypothetical protein TNCT_306881 [Trichonephila clavata]
MCSTLQKVRGDEKPKPSIADSDLRPTFQPQLPKDDTTLKTATEAIPTTTEGVEENSLMFVTSTKPNDETPFPNDIPKGCLVNGTLYGDGSAMISSSFCEYCFCIRGKTKCVKPKCDLVIDGCAPYYDSQFSCCPSKYHCHPNVITDFTDEVDIYPDLTTKAFVTNIQVIMEIVFWMELFIFKVKSYQNIVNVIIASALKDPLSVIRLNALLL